MNKIYFMPITLAIVKLRQSAFSDFINLQLAAADAFAQGKTESVLFPPYAILLGNLRRRFEHFQEVTLYVPGEEATPDVQEKDQDRDVEIYGFWAQHTYLKKKLKDAAGKKAISNLERLKKPFKNLAKWAMGAESDGIRSLLEKLRSEEYASSVTTLELEPYVQALDLAQVAFDQVFTYRLDSKTTKAEENPVKARALRKEIEYDYTVFINYVQSMVAAYPNSEWSSLMIALNMIRKDYGAKLKAAGTLAEKKKEEEV